MSDGGEEGSVIRENNKNEHQNYVKAKLVEHNDDDYGRVLTKIAVAQTCERIGFQSIQESSLEFLSEIVIKYLCDLGKTAHFYANLAGRTECHALDVIQGLEDMLSENTVGEIKRYVSLEEEVPFARDVTQIPVVVKTQKVAPSFFQIGETPDGKHVPDWLPAFPDPHTYLHTPIWNERASDPRKEKMEQARQRRKAERSLFSLQHRLVTNGSSSSSTFMNMGDNWEVKRADESDDFLDPSSLNARENGKVKQGPKSNKFFAPPLQAQDDENVKCTAESNQFLVQPLLLGEKDGSPPVVSPAKVSNEPLVINRSSMLEIFSVAIDTANIGPCDSKDDDRKVLPKRPIVNFQHGVRKKSLGVPLDLTLHKKIVGETVHLVGRSDDKDDKKRRAEYILKQSIRNAQEHVQL